MSILSWLVGTPSQSDSAVNIASPAFKANPYDFYARLRAEAPVYTVKLPDKQSAWLLTRYADVAAVFKDDRFAKDRLNALSSEQLAKQPWIPKFFEPLLYNMLDQDPPNHTRLRGLVQKGFTPKLVEGMRERIQRLADELLDGVQKRGGMDLIRDYAGPIPTTIIAEMLGVPVEDRHKFQRWSRILVTASSGASWSMLLAMPSVLRFMRYIRRLVEKRRREPRGDLISALVQAEEAGEQLNADEMLAMIILLLIAGHETTVNLIGNGTLALLRNPGELERLRGDPSLIGKAVEELLRFESPVEMATERYAREDVAIAGSTIPKGSLVFGVIASANRDEQQFPNAGVLDISREPNKHLAFGLGIHFCLGASLARMEGQIAINTLLSRTTRLRLAVSENRIRWRKGLVLRGLEALPVAFGE